MRDFYVDVGDILGSGSTDYAIIPLGDSLHENAAHTTVTTVGSGAGDGLEVTYSGDRDDFAVPVAYGRNQHRQPSMKTNGTTEEADSPDADFWSFISGGVDAAGSVGAWTTQFTVDDIEMYMAKVAASQNEWAFFMRDDKLEWQTVDLSAGVTVKRLVDAGVLAGERAFWIAAYDGRGGADAMDGLTIYKNGLVEASTVTNNASYVDTENGTALLEVFFNVSASFFSGLMQGGAIGPFKTNQELTAAQAFNLYQVGLAAQKATRSPLLSGVF